jgi:hypothetical protein
MPRPDLQSQLAAISDDTQIYTQFNAGVIEYFTVAQLKAYILTLSNPYAGLTDFSYTPGVSGGTLYLDDGVNAIWEVILPDTTVYNTSGALTGPRVLTGTEINTLSLSFSGDSYTHGSVFGAYGTSQLYVSPSVDQLSILSGPIGYSVEITRASGLEQKLRFVQSGIIELHQGLTGDIDSRLYVPAAGSEMYIEVDRPEGNAQIGIATDAVGDIPRPFVKTKGMADGVVYAGQFLKLIDDVEGYVEFGDLTRVPVVVDVVTYTMVDEDLSKILYAKANSNAVTIELFPSPIDGDMAIIKAIDLTNDVTIDRNGNNIEGVAENYVFADTNAIHLQWVDSESSWFIV